MHDVRLTSFQNCSKGEELREQLNYGSLPQRKALDYAHRLSGSGSGAWRGILIAISSPKISYHY